MCLVALAVARSVRFPLVVAANRDEYFDRPTAPLDWWPADGRREAILAGRDLRGGGTWLGVTRAGRLGLLTNVREPGRGEVSAPSRGAIVPLWLQGDLDAAALDARLAATPYNGFNLLAGARDAIFHASNRAPRRPLAAGVHGLSNAGLDTPWPKVVRLRERLAAALDACHGVEPLCEALWEALADPLPAPDEELPDTGVALDWERLLSPAFIRPTASGYGTRCSTVLVAERSQGAGRALRLHVRERSFDPDGGERRHVIDDWGAGAARV